MDFTPRVNRTLLCLLALAIGQCVGVLHATQDHGGLSTSHSCVLCIVPQSDCANTAAVTASHIVEATGQITRPDPFVSHYVARRSIPSPRSPPATS